MVLLCRLPRRVPSGQARVSIAPAAQRARPCAHQFVPTCGCLPTRDRSLNRSSRRFLKRRTNTSARRSARRVGRHHRAAAEPGSRGDVECGRMAAVTRFLLQMAGRSGAGKSTVAAGIAARTGAVIIDIDVLKSTVLDVGVEWDLAGTLGYHTAWSLADDLLRQGCNVIIDSPCRFANIVTRTMAVAEQQRAVYCFIECAIGDKVELTRRLRTRPRMRSQLTDVDALSADAPLDADLAQRVGAGDDTVWATAYPPTPWCPIDTNRSLKNCVDDAIAYLQDRRTSARR